MDLKLFRKVSKITQGELAELFGCSTGHISNIEAGNRSLTGLQVRLLIERYGLEAVSKYCDPSELPQQSPLVQVDMSRGGRTEITGDNASVNNGSGTQNVGAVDANLIDTMKKQAELLNNQSQQITSLIQQQARLIALLEAKN